jgi:hypothetical protein
MNSNNINDMLRSVNTPKPVRVANIIELLKRSAKVSIIDNDFEAGYNIDYKAYKKYTKDEIIEAALILIAIKEEIAASRGFEDEMSTL